MATIDQQFVEYIVKTLVSNPDEVSVDRKIDEKGVLLSLTVAPEDVGRVIGKRGVTAQSIRMLLRALGTKQDARYNLKIVNSDKDTEKPEKSAKKEDFSPKEDIIDAEITDDGELEELDEATALKNISTMPAHVKCATLAWHTLDNALKNSDGGNHA